MALKFAYRWNWDYAKNKAFAFDFAAARALQKSAIADVGGAALQRE